MADKIIGVKSYLFNYRSKDRRFMCEASKNVMEHINQVFAKNIDQESTSRKLELYFAHDSNILSALALMNQLEETCMPPYNSYLRFELFEENKEHYVKVSLNNDVIPVCKQEYCTYEEFSNLIRKNIHEKCN